MRLEIKRPRAGAGGVEPCWPRKGVVMGIVPCERCDDIIDLDIESEVVWEEDKCTHWHCLTDEEQEAIEKKEMER
jgi:hypothetical protein